MYGFVYIWRDRKHKRFYIGSHWGTEDDGYVCSSRWMRNARRRRPKDFKRRILSRINSSRKDLLIEEFRWLQFVKKEEIGIRYYNLRYATEHWSAYPDKLLTIGEKISLAIKGKKYPNRKMPKQPIEVIEKRKKTCKERNITFDWNKGRIQSEEEKQKRSGKIAWNKGLSSSDKRIAKGGKKSGQSRKGKSTPWNKKNMIKVKCPYCIKEGNAVIMKRWHFENCKLKME
jgi:hypothetical protein